MFESWYLSLSVPRSKARWNSFGRPDFVVAIVRHTHWNYLHRMHLPFFWCVKHTDLWTKRLWHDGSNCFTPFFEEPESQPAENSSLTCLKLRQTSALQSCSHNQLFPRGLSARFGWAAHPMVPVWHPGEAVISCTSLGYGISNKIMGEAGWAKISPRNLWS